VCIIGIAINTAGVVILLCVIAFAVLTHGERRRQRQARKMRRDNERAIVQYLDKISKGESE